MRQWNAVKPNLTYLTMSPKCNLSALLRTAPLALFVVLCTACTNQDRAASNGIKAAAKVNGAVISQQAVATAAPEEDASGRLTQLEQFIEQQLLANAAEEGKLDNDAKVIVALETAKRQILARAYVAKLAASLPKPTDTEIGRYYDQHPELFAKRRSYRLMEMAITVTPDRIDEVTRNLKTQKTFNERTAWLKQTDIPFTIGMTVKSAEQLSPTVLAMFAKLKEGDDVNVPSPTGLTAIRIVSADNQPLLLAQSQANIARYLANTGLVEAIGKETKRLRADAKIEFVPPYIPTKAK